MKPIKEMVYDSLHVQVYEDKVQLGKAAAAFAERLCHGPRSKQRAINLLFSTGASQFEFAAALGAEPQIPWNLVQAFHLDEYQGMAADHPASFRLWLKTRIEDPFKPAAFHYIEGDAADVEAECRRYEQLVRENPMDIGFIGIGENGHIAFNDPPVADFDDPLWVKVVELDEACRQQQLGEGWFAALDEVPKYAITLTVPAIMACRSIVSVVPDSRKAEAVKRALEGPISTDCPASILRRHPRALLFLDRDSAAGLEGAAW